MKKKMKKLKYRAIGRMYRNMWNAKGFTGELMKVVLVLVQILTSPLSTVMLMVIFVNSWIRSGWHDTIEAYKIAFAYIGLAEAAMLAYKGFRESILYSLGVLTEEEIKTPEEVEELLHEYDEIVAEM